MLAYSSVTSALSAEHVWGCLPGNVSHHMKFCNRSVPIEERVADLLANLTLKEKAGLLGAGTTTCAFMDAGVERLGIPVYTWCVETNSGAGGICVAEGKCQSTFPAAAGLAATFNRTVWRTKGEIISTELRALNNIGGMRMGGPNDYIGLNGWGPNINVRVHTRPPIATATVQQHLHLEASWFCSRCSCLVRSSATHGTVAIASFRRKTRRCQGTTLLRWFVGCRKGLTPST